MDTSSEQLRIQILYRQSFTTQMIGLINAGVFWFISKEFVTNNVLAIWFSFVTIIYTIRYVFQLWFRGNYIEKNREFNPNYFENIFAIGAFAIATCWAVAGTFLLAPSAMAQHAFSAFMLAGITAGAAVAYCTSMKSVYAFLLPSIIPFAIRILFEGDTVHYGMSFLCFLYVIVLSFSMRRINKITMESIMLRFEKDQLINELHRTQGHMLQSAKMASLGEMASGLAHEINNPLGIILMNLEVLKRMIKNQEIDEKSVASISGKIESTVERIARIIRSLRFFASEDQKDIRQKVLVSAIIEETMNFCQSRFENHNIQLEIKPVDSGCYLICNSAQISHILLNLINNAFEAVFGQPDAKVTIEAMCDQKNVKLLVSDNGKGVPESIRDKIMQPFFTTKEVGMGPGLGLSISFGIVESYGGILRLKPSDKGACFEVTIPIGEFQA